MYLQHACPQCVPLTHALYAWDIFIATQDWNKLYASLSRAFSLLSFDTKHIMAYLNADESKGNNLNSCMSKRDLRRIMVWVIWPSSDSLIHVQNKESKIRRNMTNQRQKKYRINVFQHVPFVLKRDSRPTLSPLNPFCANQEVLTSPFDNYGQGACSCMANTSCNWCQKTRINWLLKNVSLFW